MLRIDGLELDDSPLKSYLEQVKEASPKERGDKLLEDEAMMSAHTEVLDYAWALLVLYRRSTIFRQLQVDSPAKWREKPITI